MKFIAIKRLNKVLVIGCLAWLVGFSAVRAQQAVSPLTQNGLGRIHSPVFSVNQGMGGLLAGYTSATSINNGNPASYSSLVLTTLEMGAYFRGHNIQQASGNLRSTGANISHFAMGVPIKAGKAGMAFGLTPFSTLRYEYANTATDPNIGEYSAFSSGDGSTYRLFFGSGVKFGDLSIGANGNFIFGSNDYLSGANFADSLNLIDVQNHRQLKMRGLRFNLGAQYTFTFRDLVSDEENQKPLYLTVGATATPTIRMRSITSDWWETFVDAPTITEPIALDTADGGTFDVKSRVRMPWTFTGGFMVSDKKRWKAGLDFTYSTWENTSFPTANGTLANSWQVAAGGEFTPVKDKGNYLNRMQYRLGFYTGQTEQVVDNQQVSVFGTTFGLSFPVKRSLSRINLNTDVGRYSAGETSQVFYNLTVGYVLNSKWFIKTKYD